MTNAFISLTTESMITMKNRKKKAVSTLVESLDILMALYLKETGRYYPDNPVTISVSNTLEKYRDAA